MNNGSFRSFSHVAMAIDPVHVGTGGARLGRVDNTIVRDPVTKVPKIPGSSLAGVLRTYVAMHEQNANGSRQVDGNDRPYYPDCAGQGQPRRDGTGGHCGQASCKVCTVFGFARGGGGGFAGLAAFSDAHVLLFPVATRQGPVWVTSPSALRQIAELRNLDDVAEDLVHRASSSASPLNLGWLLLPVRVDSQMKDKVGARVTSLGVPGYIADRLAVVSDRLFSHVVNSNLEVRTSVAIDPATGAAEDGALFSYEALPRATVVYWDATCRNPAHFKVGQQDVAAVTSTGAVHEVVATGFPFLEALGIGGMGSRGMGRLRVLDPPSGSGDTDADTAGDHSEAK